jgi:hypothetical protein
MKVKNTRHPRGCLSGTETRWATNTRLTDKVTRQTEHKYCHALSGCRPVLDCQLDLLDQLLQHVVTLSISL